MKLTIVGTGLAGLVAGAGLAELGHEVLCVDPDQTRIARLQRGDLPLLEPGLAELMARHVACGRLRFSTDLREGVGFGAVQVIAVETPADKQGAIDMQQMLVAAYRIGLYMNDYKLVVDKSTGPVGSADAVRAAISAGLAERGVDLGFDVVSNPCFAPEGTALQDFLNPARIVVGADAARAVELMKALYAPLRRTRERLVLMDIRSAELSKYAASAMLAARLSVMNEIAGLAGKLGADIEQVRRGLADDPRIGAQHLAAGCGWGGEGLPKDLTALQQMAQWVGEPLPLLGAVTRANERQKLLLVEHVVERFGEDLQGRHFALWGLAHQPGSSELREAPSRVVIHELLRRGATLCAHDPQVLAEARRVFNGVPGIGFAATPLDAAIDADALLLLTDWNDYLAPDFDALQAALRRPMIFDGRNLYVPEQMRGLGFDYISIGRPAQWAAEAVDSVHIDLPLAA